VFLDGTADVIASRLGGRSGHYMPGSLLAGQLQTLERPAHDETDVACFDIVLAPDEIVRRAAAWVRTRGGR